MNGQENEPRQLDQPSEDIRHDSENCMCGFDSFEEKPDGPACECRCLECKKRRDRVLELWRLNKLYERLTKAGIGLGDLATLIWRELETDIDQRIEKLACDALERATKDMRLVSYVQHSSFRQ